MRHAHDVDQVAGIVGERGSRQATRLADVGPRAEHLAHVLGRALEVSPGEDLQPERRQPADKAVRQPDRNEAHQERCDHVRPVHVSGTLIVARGGPQGSSVGVLLELPDSMTVSADELRAALEGLHARISTLLVRL